MAPLRRLVVDVLKPHEPPIVEFSTRLAETLDVAGVTASLVEHDAEVQNVKITLEGENVDYGSVDEAIDQLGGTIHSVDQVACGDYVVEDRPTPQDA